MVALAGLASITPTQAQECSGIEESYIGKLPGCVNPLQTEEECEDLRDDRLIQAHNVLESRQTMTDRCCDKALDLSYEIYFSEYSLISEDH